MWGHACSTAHFCSDVPDIAETLISGADMKCQLVVEGEMVLKDLLEAVVGFFSRPLPLTWTPKHCSHAGWRGFADVE